MKLISLSQINLEARGVARQLTADMLISHLFLHLLPLPALLPISEFVLNEKFQRNASKFDIFYIYVYENPKLLFSIFHFVLLYFFPLGKNIK